MSDEVRRYQDATGAIKADNKAAPLPIAPIVSLSGEASPGMATSGGLALPAPGEPATVQARMEHLSTVSMPPAREYEAAIASAQRVDPLRR